MVQMVAETVEITIVTATAPTSESPSSARAHYEARFTMRNQGQATEQMDVRFPLTDGDSWETIWDFVAFVDGEQARVRKSVEPFRLGETRIARWGVFPVTFEPGVDVFITVRYSTHISGWGWYESEDPDDAEGAFYGPMNPDTATVFYMLETGAGWYGPIETGAVVLKVPYAAGPVNVFDLDAGLAEWRPGWETANGERFVGPVFADREARWEFSQLEPTREDNLRIQFLWPGEWRRIQSLKAEARRNPRNVTAALQLAGAYLAAGAGVHSGHANDYHCLLSQQEIQRGLVYHPESEVLQEGLTFIASFCPDLAATQDQATPTSISAPTSTSTLMPTQRPTATSTAMPAPTSSPTPESLPPIEPARPVPTQAPPSDSGNSTVRNLAPLGLGAAFVVALTIGIIWSRRRSR